MCKEWRFGAQYETVKEFFNIGIKSLMTVSYAELVKALFVANGKAENLWLSQSAAYFMCR